MNSFWSSLIVETVQSGGGLIFIQDQAPAESQILLKTLSEKLQFQIPLVVRKISDFQKKKIQTRSQDLVLFFEEQKEFIAELDAVLAGQRVLLTKNPQTKYSGIDHVIEYSSVKDLIGDEIKATLSSLQKMESLIQGQEGPALFLDRDDVVVKNVPYNKDPEKVELMPGIAELIHQAHAKDLWVVLVTNQSGLGRGWVSWKEYQRVHQSMLKLLAEQGAWIDESYWSFYIDSKAQGEGHRDANLRKPRNGMFLQAQEKLHIDCKTSLMVGDSATDLIAAHSVGIQKLYLLESAKSSEEIKTLTTHKEITFTAIKNLSEVRL